MNAERLFLLLSLEPDDFKFYESWRRGDDWDWLHSNGYIDRESDYDPPTLNDKGKQTIAAAVRSSVQGL